MIWLFTIGLALLGALFEQEAGFILGALIGFLMGSVIDMRRRLSALEAGMGQDAPHTGLSEPRDQPPKAAAAVQEDPTPVPPGVDAPAPAVAPPRSAAERRAPRLASDVSRPSSGFSIPNPLLPVIRFFTTGNLVVKVGAAILFVGLAFLARYAMLHTNVPMEFRLSGIGLTGLALLGLGWRWRRRADAYGLILQGAGVAVMYLTLFTAARFYELIPAVAAFGGMAVLVTASCLLAYRQHSQSLAVLAIAGGFLTPVLTSTGSGNHVALFAYLAILNAGVFGLAWLRSWRTLNWLGFTFTTAIGGFWGARSYHEGLFASTEPFLVLFFLAYVLIGVLFTRRDAKGWQGAVDGSLLFGVPIAFFALQAGAVQHIEYGLAFSALFAALIYVALLVWLQRQGAARALIGQSFFTLAVVFASLVLPFALDDQQWTAAAWAIEGAGLAWIGARQGQLLSRLLGMALQGIAALLLIVWWNDHGDTSLILSSFMVAASALFSSYHYDRLRASLTRLEKPLVPVLLWWSVVLWASGVLNEIDLRFTGVDQYVALVLSVALTGLALAALVRFARWPTGQAPVWATIPLLTALALTKMVFSSAGALGNAGWLAWAGAAVAVVAILKWADERAPTRWLTVSHANALGLVVLLITWFAYRWLDAQVGVGDGWDVALWTLAPALLAYGVASLSGRGFWPLDRHSSAYVGIGGLPIVVWSLAWVWLGVFSDAEPRPVGYLPIVNPAELAGLCSLALAWRWLQQQQADATSTWRLSVAGAIGASGLWLLMTAAARFVHFYYGVAYLPDAIVESAVYQTLISIIWTVVALGLMAVGARQSHRTLWLVGAGLLALTVVKLIVVDLSAVGTIERIVSFVSVGVLTLAIGYFAPLPPRSTDQDDDGQPGAALGEGAQAEGDRA